MLCFSPRQGPIWSTGFLFQNPAVNLFSQGVPIPLNPKEFILYYVAFTVLALIAFFRRRPRRGMRLKLRGQGNSAPKGQLDGVPEERSLNVVFQYDGQAWDAYEVLDLPAGSSLEKVEQIYKQKLTAADAGSRPFLEAAYQAIRKR